MTKPKAHRQHVQVGRRYITTNAVLLRYDIAESSLQRWLNDARIGFPAPVQITPGGHNFYDADELDAFDRRQAEQARARRAERAIKKAQKPAKPDKNEPADTPPLRFARGERAKASA